MKEKRRQIRIYDRTAGCACRPGEQRGMMVLRSIIYGLKKELGDTIAVTYYTYDRDQVKFTEDEQISSLISENGLEILPVTVIDGKICKSRAIPSLAEFREYLSK